MEPISARVAFSSAGENGIPEFSETSYLVELIEDARIRLSGPTGGPSNYALFRLHKDQGFNEQIDEDGLKLLTVYGDRVGWGVSGVVASIRRSRET